MSQLHTSVVVIGGSLVGLSAALFLCHHQVSVIVLERHIGRYPHPRAISCTTRTIEYFRSVGIADKLPSIAWTGGPPRRSVVESLSEKWQDEQPWTAGPKNVPKPEGNKADMLLSPVTGLASAQDTIGPVLREAAVQRGADLRLGCTVNGWSQDVEGVQVNATNGRGNTVVVHGRYHVACDGARSGVREQLGIQRDGVGHIRALRSILFRCPSIDKFLDYGYVQFQIKGRDDDFEAFMTTYGGSRWALMWNENKGDGNAKRVGVSEVEQKQWIRKAVGGHHELADSDIELVTTGEWDLGGLVADRFSHGRVFLAGDAAHSLPPNRGGYGANTGIADAYNLAWKLSAVLEGTSGPELLDTYNQERRPIARNRYDQTFARQDYSEYATGREWTWRDTGTIYEDMAMELGELYRSKGIVGSMNEDNDSPRARLPTDWSAQPGTRAPHIPLVSKTGELLSSLDLFTEWVTLSKDTLWKSAAAQAGCKFVQVGDDVTEVKDGAFVTNFGADDTGAVLIRPDGYVTWRAVKGLGDPAAALRRGFEQCSFVNTS